jgi:hypothetical protein
MYAFAAVNLSGQVIEIAFRHSARKKSFAPVESCDGKRCTFTELSFSVQLSRPSPTRC